MFFPHLLGRRRARGPNREIARVSDKNLLRNATLSGTEWAPVAEWQNSGVNCRSELLEVHAYHQREHGSVMYVMR